MKIIHLKFCIPGTNWIITQLSFSSMEDSLSVLLSRTEKRLWALWKVECIYVYFLGYCSMLPVFMDFHTSINPLISFSIKMIYCFILIFVIFSLNKLSEWFSSALKRNWKGIDEKELELLFVIPKELELELNVKELELELNWKKGIDPSPGFECALLCCICHLNSPFPYEGPHRKMTKPAYICCSRTFIWSFNRLKAMTESVRIISYSFWIVKIDLVIAEVHWVPLPF